jgi:hypothetical protein
VVPQDDDDDTDVEMMTEEDFFLESKTEKMDAVAIQKSAQEAYNAMFRSPTTTNMIETAVIEDETDDDVFEDEGKCAIPHPLPAVKLSSVNDVGIKRKGGICSRIMAQQGISTSSVDMGIEWVEVSASVGGLMDPLSAWCLERFRCRVDLHLPMKTRQIRLSFSWMYILRIPDRKKKMDLLSWIRCRAALVELCRKWGLQFDHVGKTLIAVPPYLKRLHSCSVCSKTKEETSGNTLLLMTADRGSMSTALSNIQTMEAF